MAQTRSVALARKPLARCFLLAVVLCGSWQRPALAQGTEVTGSAYGFFTSVGLFGGPPNDVGPVPLVTLPPEGSPEPITASDPDGDSATYGPAVIVETTGMTVSTEGASGPDGSVTSSSSVQFDQNQDEQPDPFNADEVRSMCTASGSGTSGSVVLDNASLVLNTDVETQEPAETIDLPVDPAPNTTYGGTIDHVGDSFRVVFNEQILEGGTLTVNAVHLYLGQNAAGEEVAGVARGEAIIGQSVCGAGASGSSQPGDGGAVTTTQPAETTTTEGVETTTTTGQAASEIESAEGAGPLVVGAVVVGGGALVGLLVWLRRRGGGGTS